MNEKFVSLKKRYEELTKAKEPKPATMGTQPLTTTSRPVSEGSFPESGKETFALGAPRDWQGKTPSGIQTGRKDFSKDPNPEPAPTFAGINAKFRTLTPDWANQPEEQRNKNVVDPFAPKPLTPKEQEQKNIEDAVGIFSHTIGQQKNRGANYKSEWTKPQGVLNAVDTLAGEFARKLPSERRHDHLWTVLAQFGNRMALTSPLASMEEQRQRVASHGENKFAQNLKWAGEGRKEQSQGLTTIASGQAVAQRGGENIKVPERGILPSETWVRDEQGKVVTGADGKPQKRKKTDEELRNEFHNVKTAEEITAHPGWESLKEQEPTLSQIGRVSQINALKRGSLQTPRYRNLDNSPEEIANSGMYIPSSRKDQWTGSIVPQTSKETTTNLFFPGKGEKLYFQEHAQPSTDHDQYLADIENTPREHVEAAHAESHKLKTLLGNVHDELRGAMHAHARGDIHEHLLRLDRAKAYANQAGDMAHNTTHEAISGHDWLKNLDQTLDVAAKHPQTASKDQISYKTAMERVKNATASHLNNLSAIGPAFSESHVHRVPLLNQATLEQMDQAPAEHVPGQPLPPRVQATPEQYREENPLNPEEIKRQGKWRNVVADSDKTADPDDLHNAISSRLSVRPEDDSFVSEAKLFAAANQGRAFTHPHEHPGGAINPHSEQFLGSVPITQLHNYFDPEDHTDLNDIGMPARAFVKHVTSEIMKEGMGKIARGDDYTDPKTGELVRGKINPQGVAEMQEFSALDKKYNNGSITPDEHKRYGELLQKITHEGMAQMHILGKLSPRGKKAFDMARFIGASRQQRQDYIGDISSNQLVNQAEAIHQSPMDADQKIEKLKNLRDQIQFKKWVPMSWESASGENVGVRDSSQGANRGSYASMKAKRHIADLLTDTYNQKTKTNMGKSMGNDHERLKKCKDFLVMAKDKLNKAIGPQGKYVKAPDGSLVLVDMQSKAAQQQQKDVARVQQQPTKVAPAVTLPPPKPKTATEELPAIPKPPVQSQPEIPKQAPRPAPQPPKPPAPPKQGLPQPPKPALGQKPAESIGDVARKLKAESAMAVFGYTPKK